MTLLSVRVKPMYYTPDDVKEFEKQIQELLQQKLIRPSKNPHSVRKNILFPPRSVKWNNKKKAKNNYTRHQDLSGLA
jgi:hypothetical protein